MAIENSQLKQTLSLGQQKRDPFDDRKENGIMKRKILLWVAGITVIIVTFLCCRSINSFNRTYEEVATKDVFYTEVNQTSETISSIGDAGTSKSIYQIPVFDEKDQKKLEKERDNNDMVTYPLSDTERTKLQHLQQEIAGLDPNIDAKTAALLAEYFCRCQRLEPGELDVGINSIRYERDSETDWEYWILTSSSGAEYWFSGFTVNGRFELEFIDKDSLEGELLFGTYE